eukprot:4783187-Prymnesium_polylepis.2
MRDSTAPHMVRNRQLESDLCRRRQLSVPVLSVRENRIYSDLCMLGPYGLWPTCSRVGTRSLIYWNGGAVCGWDLGLGDGVRMSYCLPHITNDPI